MAGAGFGTIPPFSVSLKRIQIDEWFDYTSIWNKLEALLSRVQKSPYITNLLFRKLWKAGLLFQIVACRRSVLCKVQIGLKNSWYSLASWVSVPEAKKRRKYFRPAPAVAPLASIFCHHPGISGFWTSIPRMFDVLLLVSTCFLQVSEAWSASDGKWITTDRFCC